MLDSLTLLPEVQARRLLADRALTISILRPPYPALGVGALRVLRVRESPAAVIELTVGYDNYEALA
jgi:hypothetical protein